MFILGGHMTTSWYYVENNDRVGPVEENDLAALIRAGSLLEDSYVWKKGFDNWEQLKDVAELQQYMGGEDEVAASDIPDKVDSYEEVVESDAGTFNWSNISNEKRVFSVKIGLDRGEQEVEYGPYSLDLIKRLFLENRINGRTMVFAPGMDNWTFLADLPVYEKLFQEVPPIISDNERRVNSRKPFVAKMFFHDNSKVYEGICRDISIGGLQVLVSDVPVNLGDDISLNVHPDNSEYSFVASGRIVRILSGNQGFSIRFSELNDEALKAINSYLSQV